MSSECEGKSSWPELVGKQGEAAKDIIERENPNVTAQIVLEGTIVDQQFLCTRVWVWVNTAGFVTRTPQIAKNSWPELVGVKSEVAEKKVQTENPSVKSVNIVREGSFVTMDIRSDRVRIWVDENGIVTRVPKIG